MKKICILSLLLSLVSFSKGYVETYGKFNIESNGNNKVDEAGVRLNVEQGKFKFKTNIGVDGLYFKKFEDEDEEKKELVLYPEYGCYGDMNNYAYVAKKNIIKDSKASLEYAMIRDEKANATLKAKIEPEKYGDILREYVQFGADVNFKFKNGLKLGTENSLNCYFEKEKRLRTQNKIYLAFNIPNKFNIKTNFGIDYFSDTSKWVDEWDPMGLCFTTGLDFSAKFNKYTKIKGKFDAVTEYYYSLKPYAHLNYFGIGNLEKLYEDEEFKYLKNSYEDIWELREHEFLAFTHSNDRRCYPNSLLKAYLNIQHKKNNFKLKIIPFVNINFGHRYPHIKEHIGVVYGVNTEISNKFSNKYLLGTKVKIVETLRNLDYLSTFSKGNFLDLSIYSAYEGKINDKLVLIPKINFEYLNKYKKQKYHYQEDEKYSNYLLHKLRGEVGLELKYNITNNLMLNAEAIAGLKFVKGKYEHFSKDKKRNLSDKAISEYLKLNFNMKYEWK
ncbi:hypothetical protein [Sneathia sanguinegens]|uniref:hypothetical protein n=1 Tax=Sneathia sanguinegens TaxID=40543 RepID=UPI0023F7A54D|nr:hypothetical protein [Sneathia sanguinegens]MDU4653146.1 hypothetical protein [Sneathia sanguinegens]